MSDNAQFPPPDAASLMRNWGFWGALAGGVGLSMVFLYVAAPMMEPSPPVGQQVGEIAGEIRRAAWRSFLGLPPKEVVPEPVRLTDYLAFAGPVFGIVAVILSLVAALRREDRRLVTYGLGLGTAAIFFQIVWMVTLVICGILLLIAIIQNIGDIFSF